MPFPRRVLRRFAALFLAPFVLGCQPATVQPMNTSQSAVLDPAVAETALAKSVSPTTTEATTGPLRPFIEAQRPLAVAGQDGYEYYQVAAADFDGDGDEERAFLIADAAVVNGDVLWDDGHVWQLYIEEPTGERTYVYVRFVQLGTVEAKVTQEAADHIPHILMLEQWPDLFRVYEVVYHGPNDAHIVLLVERPIANTPSRWFTEPTPEK